MKGADESFAREDPATLKANGITWLARYLTGAGKALTMAEAESLHAAGLGIVLTFEAGAADALAGAAQGRLDGQAAKAAADAIGAPAGAAIYFTVDTDTADLTDVEAYGRAFAAAISPHPCGVYAEGAILTDLVHLGVAVYTWQTDATAWQGGVDQQADIIQGPGALGGQIDLDTTTADFGAWWPAGAVPQPQPAPAPAPPAVTTIDLGEDDMKLSGITCPASGPDGKGWTLLGDCGLPGMAGKVGAVTFNGNNPPTDGGYPSIPLFGISDRGDDVLLEWTGAAPGARFGVRVLHS